MLSALSRRSADLMSPLLRGSRGRKGKASRAVFGTLDDLVDDHFTRHSQPDHVCRPTLAAALAMLSEKPAYIVETGSSAWGSNSSLLFDSYVNSFGGAFATVDIRLEPTFTLRGQCTRRTTLHCDDSVRFLARHVSTDRRPDLVYLDSWDVDWDAPLPSAMHGLHEFMVLLPGLRSGGLLLIDDTPRDETVMQRVQPRHVGAFAAFERAYGFPPGKGALVRNFLVQNSIGKQLRHDYQLLWQF